MVYSYRLMIKKLLQKHTQTKVVEIDTHFLDENGYKPLPFGATHTYSLLQIRDFCLAGITSLKKNRERKIYIRKGFWRSSKVTPSRKCVVFVDKSAL